MSWPSWLTPKRYQIGALVVLATVAVSREPAAVTGLLATVATTVAVDLCLTRLRRGIWFVPEAAIISGVIISLVLLPAPIIWPVLAGFVAMTGKQLFSFKGPVLNPATAGMVSAFIIALLLGREFHLGWLGDSMPLLTLILGLSNAHRNNKWPQVATFLISYLLFQSLIADRWVLQAGGDLWSLPWFFILYMLTEPRTSPNRLVDQIIFGLITGALGIGLTYARSIGEFSLLLGLLSGNVFWALRRLRSAKPAT